MRPLRPVLSAPIPAFLLFTSFLFAQDDQAARIARVEQGLLPPVLIEGDAGWTIEARMKHYNIPGVSVAVFHGDRVVWAKGYGVMDNDTKEPVTDRTLFVAGSISKPVAVAGALRLVREGAMALDSNINRYLTTWKLPENEFTAKQAVTLRLLASHNAGVTVHGFPGYAAGTPVPTIVQILNGEAPANTAPIRVDIVPGTRWRYAGGGTTVMQLAMEDVSGLPFAALMEQKVLAPIGMTSSSYEQTLTGERLARAASGHKADGRVIPGKRHLYPEMAAAGLWTTPADLCRFAIEVGRAARGMSDRVLTKELASAMITKHMALPGFGEMALGFFLEKHRGAVYYGHGGVDEGFIARLLASPNSYGAAVMTNSDGRAFGLIDEIYRSIAKEYGWEGYLPQPVVAVKVDRSVLEQYTGRYRTRSDEHLTVELRGDGLVGSLTDSEPFQLVPVSPSLFVQRERDVKLEFTGVENGKAQMATAISGERKRPATRVADGSMPPLELLRAGKTDEALKAYRAIYQADPKDPDVDEGRLNNLGYISMGRGLLDQAIAIFRLNVEFYPEAWNVYDSLGEGLMNKGETAEAIRNYERSIELNPENKGGMEMLKKLRERQ